MVVWSAGRPRSRSNSSTSRYESENRRYQRTAQTMISGSKCRHLNSAGRGLIMEYTCSLSDSSTESLQHSRWDDGESGSGKNAEYPRTFHQLDEVHEFL